MVSTKHVQVSAVNIYPVHYDLPYALRVDGACSSRFLLHVDWVSLSLLFDDVSSGKSGDRK